MSKKFLQIMLNKKVLPVVLIVLIGGSFWAFKSKGSNDNDLLAKQQLLLTQIGVLLEQKHYDPKKIDDSFSKDIFKKYLEALDPDKDILIAPDVESLKKYDTTIDDEIHGTVPIMFYPAAEAIFTKRLKETSLLCKEILSIPFNFNEEETVQLDRDKLDFPISDADKKEVWRKRLKYLTLDRFIGLQDERSKSVIDSIKKRTDSDLERVARQKVLQGITRNFERIEKTFTEEEFFNTFVYTITTAMDPHTEYFPPVEKRSFDEDMSGKFYGIGAQLKEDDDAIKISTLIPGSPAWKSGKILVNDVIVKVGQGNAEPVDITGYGVTDAVKLIRGEKGTEVKLTLKKIDGTLQVVSIIRDEIVQDEAYARSTVIEKNGKKTGYIFLPEFYADYEKPDGRRCSSDVASEIEKLKAENVDGIILDLRNNGGGYLSEVVEMAGLFIKSGPIVQVKDREGRPNILSDRDTSVLYNGPLAVMVNELSASASEIFAAAIQDYKRGIIIGSTTYGKGTVQKPIPLGKPLDYFSGQTEDGALKLTFEKFYRVTGASTQLKGVTPDIILPDTYEYSKIREKDNTSALKWDQIPKSDYTTWMEGAANLTKIQADVQQQVNQNVSFSKLQNNVQWLNNNIDKEYDLKISKYKAEEVLIKKAVTQDDSLVKSDSINIYFMNEDKEKFSDNPDQAKADRYKQWLKVLQKDLYIEETFKVISAIASDTNKNLVLQ